MPASAVDPDYVGTYPDFVGTHPEPLRVTVVTTITPRRWPGAHQPAGRVRPDAPWTYLERLAAVPATDPHALLLLPTGKHPGFVAVAPDGAIAQLLTQDGQVRDSATIHQGLATLCVRGGPPGTTFRLRVLAPDGHVVYDAVPPQPVELLDSGRDRLSGPRAGLAAGCRPAAVSASVEGSGARATRGVALWREPAAHRPVLARRGAPPRARALPAPDDPRPPAGHLARRQAGPHRGLPARGPAPPDPRLARRRGLRRRARRPHPAAHRRRPRGRALARQGRLGARRPRRLPAPRRPPRRVRRRRRHGALPLARDAARR